MHIDCLDICKQSLKGKSVKLNGYKNIIVDFCVFWYSSYPLHYDTNEKPII